MSGTSIFKRWVRRVVYFFPLQLLLLHIKKNHLLLLCWLIFFAYITESIGVKYGIPYLFLFPEYFGVVSFWSFLLLGFSFGGFVVAFNLYTYTAHAYRFPFITTIARPFLKFTVNNAVIPVLFGLTYLFCSARLQLVKELIPPAEVVLHLSGFVLGGTLFLALALLYFTRTNIDIHTFLGKDVDTYQAEQPLEDIVPPRPIPPLRQEQRKATRWLRREQRTRKWKVETYLTPRLRIMLARSSEHYDKDLLRSVLWQNHINGSIFEVVLLTTFIALGAFSDQPLFSIPAGASVFMLFTMVLMLFSALTSWFQGWMLTTCIVMALGLNLLSLRNDGFLYDSEAYGMDYQGPPAPYEQPVIAAMANDTVQAYADAEAMLPALRAWSARNEQLPHPAGGKPKLVIVNTSGGGSRAMLWTFRSLQVADSLVGGGLMDRTALITGSSGGLIGAAYFRSLVQARRTDPQVDLSDPKHVDQMSSDILNPLGFSFVTNDMFLRYRKVKDGDRSYTLDRGHAFERRLAELTEDRLDVRLADLRGPEQRGDIPMLVVSPVSTNDGRRVVISALPAAYLTNIAPTHQVHASSQPEAIEFSKLFADQGADRLKLSSALRMSATFPYITPVVTLPSEPPMRVMDAGLRDNYGYRTTLMFLYTFRDWIAENTSGVVMLQMRDKQKELQVKPVGGSMIGRLFDPVGSVIGNVVRIQDQDYDIMLKQSDAWMPFPLDIIELQLRHEDHEEISLSWHLTAVERRQVLRSVSTPENAAAFQEFQWLVQGGR